MHWAGHKYLLGPNAGAMRTEPAPCAPSRAGCNNRAPRSEPTFCRQLPGSQPEVSRCTCTRSVPIGKAWGSRCRGCASRFFVLRLAAFIGSARKPTTAGCAAMYWEYMARQSQEERRERRVVRAPELIAFGHGGCRGGISVEHVIGFVRHNRRLLDVVRRVAADRRCQSAHRVYSLNERGRREIVAVS